MPAAFPQILANQFGNCNLFGQSFPDLPLFHGQGITQVGYGIDNIELLLQVVLVPEMVKQQTFNILLNVLTFFI